MMNPFTQRSKRVLNYATNEAVRLNSPQIGTEHLLAGLVLEGDGVAAKILQDLGFDGRRFLEELDADANPVPDGTQPEYSPRAKRVLELSRRASMAQQVNYIATEHLLLGIILEAEGAGGQILARAGITTEKVWEIVSRLGGGAPSGTPDFSQGQTGPQGMETANKNSDTPELDKVSRDLTQVAKEGDLDPVIGRDSEIERVVQILSRRSKNNPVLIGEPGVGKTAIAEGLAQRIIQGNVPQNIADKRVVALDLSSLVAGTKYRGEFEERLQKVLQEIKGSKEIILFIDELHTLIGAGSAEGSMDAANILKPVLSRGELQCVGATTLDEYRKHIEKDSALERRFQPVMVDEPTPEETIAILYGLKDKYEAHHRVTITDEAIETAVKLSNRYITDRFLPDKAIDLIDEASSKVRIASFKTPPDLKDIESQMAEVKKEKEEAINNQEFESAAKLRDKEKELSDHLKKMKNNWQKDQTTTTLVVDGDAIADIVASWTKIPVSRLKMEEKDRLLHLEEILHKRLISQREAVKAVSGAIRRAGAGLKDEKRPIGSFLFLGPTGVGKTELAKALAEAVFGSEDAMVRIDMSEYMERFAVSRLVGAPPGYVGYDEGGQLTELVRRHPYSVILLDEIEKAHPEVFNILLQVLDDGRLTDSLGRTVDFRNTIIIMTSNAGAQNVYNESKSMGFLTEDNEMDDYESLREKYMADLKNTFRPEFINRVDEIIVFHPLHEDDIVQIADLMLADVTKRVAEQNIHVEVSEEAKRFLAKVGYDKTFGARPLRRKIQQKVEDPLADALLSGSFAEGDVILVDVEEEQLTFHKKHKQQ